MFPNVTFDPYQDHSHTCCHEHYNTGDDDTPSQHYYKKQHCALSMIPAQSRRLF